MDNMLSEKSIKKKKVLGNEDAINPLIQLPIFMLIKIKQKRKEPSHSKWLMPPPPLERDGANKLKYPSLPKFSVV